MSTFLTILLSILAIVAVLGLVAYYKVKAKIVSAAAWLKVEGLKEAITQIDKSLAEPGRADDADLLALRQRVETSLQAAQEAYNRGDYKELSKVADPVLAELIEILQRKAEEAAARADAEAAADKFDGITIDGEATEVVESKPLALPPAEETLTDKK
ncbi:MAG: hypothetical protein KC652_12735 [Cyanobacteria bacterium HKST-UBA01]|nr:hypothetical protein [Cyanobacteria bacterium HKST-UBA01]